MECYTVPTRDGVQIPLNTQVRDALPSLDVVWGNMYENENIDIQFAMEKEAEFYRGAPPRWLNFYSREEHFTPFVKRDKYTELLSLINQNRKKHWRISTIDLFHEPGSGGTTLAMQVLWDLRKELRCARVNSSTSDPKAIAQQVLNLFKAGESQSKNTVLLLLDNLKMDTHEHSPFKFTLEHNLIDEIKQSRISTNIPVTIILSCSHQKSTTEKQHNFRQTQKSVMLSRCLSEEEERNFKTKNTEVVQRHGVRHTTFHSFNIMKSNFSQDYVTEVCRFLQPIKRKKSPRNQQLLSILALMNSYAPGSYLTEDLCLWFIDKNDAIFGGPTLKEHMEPFADILVIFSTYAAEASDTGKRIQMAHPMIADEVLRILTAAGLTRSDTTRKLIACQNEIPPYLKQIIKQLLTKRESKVNKESGEIKQDTFSKLIQDVHEKESKSMCVRLFKDAADKFTQVPVFPQALARFYYIILTDYVNATYWAKEAIKRDPKNSFIRDTLGQVYKNKLKKEIATSARDILRTGKLALEAFEDEIKIAEQEEEPGMQEDKVINTSTIFNNRGLFGYIEVANIIFNKLTCVNTEWANVLTQETQTHSLIHPQMSEEHKSLLMTLRQRLEVRFKFFQTYLTYSEPAINKKDPSYIWPSIKECYQKFIKKESQTAWQILQEGMATTFAGLLSTLEDKSVSELELITEQWRTIYEDDDDDADAAQNYILANIILSQKSSASTVPIKELQEILLQFWEKQKYDSSPEFYLLAIMLFWPDGAQPPGNPNAPDLKKCVQDMRHSYKRTYQKHLRSRYLVPLFFLGKEGLQRLVYRSRLNQTDLNCLRNGDGVEIEGLQRIRGEVRNHMIFVLRENNEMEVSAHNPASVYKSGLVSFYLGFTIRGPVAFNIRYVVSAVGFVDG